MKDYKETTIRFTDEEETAFLWTASPSIKNWLVRLKYPIHSTSYCSGTKEHSWFFQIPKMAIEVLPSRTVERKRKKLQDGQKLSKSALPEKPPTTP